MAEQNKKGKEKLPLALLTAAVSVFCILSAPVLCLLCTSVKAFFSEAAPELYISSLAVSGWLLFLLLAFEGIAAAFLSEIFYRRPTALFPHFTAVFSYAVSILALRFLAGAWMPLEALLSVIFYLSGFLLAKSRLRKDGKKQSVLWASVPAMALTVLVGVLCALRFGGGGTSFLSGLMEQVGQRWTASAEALVDQTIEDMKAYGLLDTMLSYFGSREAALTEEGFRAEMADAFEGLKDELFLFFPALLAVCCNAAGYISASISALFGKPVEKGQKWQLEASGMGVAIFLVSAMVYAFIYPLFGANVFVIVMLNLMAIYMPLMLVIGLQALRGVNRKMIRAHKFMSVIVLILLILSPLLTLSVLGAHTALSRRMQERLSQIDGGGERDE